MLLLADVKPLGKGFHRTCYPHPEDPSLCIKVVHNRAKGGDKEVEREIAYYKNLQSYLQDWKALPQYHGTVDTDCGVGYVFDRVRDYDGRASKTMLEFYSGRKLDAAESVELRSMLNELRDYIQDNRIVTMTLKPYNILCKRVSVDRMRLVICDNIGEASLIPLASHCGWFARMKAKRLWKRFLNQPLFREIGLF